ncbi:MAG: nicotinate-nucleotide adenylyltransferase [Gemmatimonadetes bacterium]|nr:nicotinate-nucleotide adenylyltransferase [Gemmatimonadota bacterium]
MNVGIFGGTFDPPHIGHLIVAQDAALALELDLIVFVPAARPPHKRAAEITAASLRAEMLRLAVEDDARFDVDTLELERPGASYTVDTLRELDARQPDTRWTLLIGADQYEEFGSWREPDEIRRLARVAVMMRDGSHGAENDGRESAEMGGPVPAGRPAGEAARQRGHRPGSRAMGGDGDVALDVTRIDVSATTVRNRVAAGLPIRYLVPRAVEKFIFERKLYIRNGTPVAG